MEYLAEIGGDDEVKIHVSDVPQMDFISKNFVYKLDFCILNGVYLNGCCNVTINFCFSADHYDTVLNEPSGLRMPSWKVIVLT